MSGHRQTPAMAMHRPSPSDSRGSRPTSARRRPPRRDRCWSSRRRAAARRRRSSPASPGSSPSGVAPDVDPRRSRSTSAPRSSSTERLDAALAPLGRRAGRRPRPDVPRAGPRDPARRRRARSSRSSIARPSCATVAPGADEAARWRLDTRHLAAQGRARRHGRRGRRRPGGRSARAGLRRLRARGRARRGGLDFDDLVLRAIARARARIRRCSAAGAALRATCSSTRSRTSTAPSSASRCCSRRRRTGSSSSATTTSRSTAGDSPTSGGSWRSSASLPGLRRVDLEVNYRCPAPVVERAVRLVEHNARAVREADPRRPGGGRAARPGARCRRRHRPARAGDRGRWPDDDSTRAVLARTNRELLPAVVVALRLGIPFRAPAARRCRSRTRASTASWTEPRGEAAAGRAAPRSSLGAGPRRRRDRTPTDARPRDGPARLGGRPTGTSASLDGGDPRGRATAWPTSDATMPPSRSRRRTRRRASSSTTSSSSGWRRPVPERAGRRRAPTDPARAYEEERRLAYVAWTRARRSLTLLYDPAVPSPFLLEAFTPDELGLDGYDGRDDATAERSAPAARAGSSSRCVLLWRVVAAGAARAGVGRARPGSSTIVVGVAAHRRRRRPRGPRHPRPPRRPDAAPPPARRRRASSRPASTPASATRSTAGSSLGVGRLGPADGLVPALVVAASSCCGFFAAQVAARGGLARSSGSPTIRRTAPARGGSSPGSVELAVTPAGGRSRRGTARSARPAARRGPSPSAP